MAHSRGGSRILVRGGHKLYIIYIFGPNCFPGNIFLHITAKNRLNNLIDVQTVIMVQ